MNKLFSTFVLLISTVCFSQAQDGYVKFNADSPFRGGNVKIFQGEIIPYLNSTKPNRIDLIVGKDTITELNKTSKSYEVVSPSKLIYLSQKDEFIKLRKGVGIVVNINSIDAADSAVVYSESKAQLTKLVNEREATIRKEDCGNSIRLVISNAPTIYYSVQSLKEFVEPETPQVTDSPETKPAEEPKSGLVWWMWLLIGLGVCGIGFGVWRIIKKRKKGKANTEVFNSSSLKDFALKYGGVKKLSDLNPNLIPANWDKLQNSEKQRIINNLQGKRIIVREEPETSFAFQENKNSYTDEAMTREWESPKETFVQPTNYSNNDGILSELRQMENRIKQEVRTYGSNNNNSNELNKLNREITELRTDKNKVESEKQNLLNTISQLQKDKTTAENNLQTATTETLRVQNEMKELKEKVIAVDFLKAYSESVFSYLKYCQQVSSDAFNFFNKISQQNPKQAFAAGHLLMKFQSAVNSIPVGDWLRTVQDIKDSGATTNRQLTRSFSQIQNDSEKQKEFQRLLFSEVLTKYSSNILILAEAFKNLSRFQGSADFTSEAQSTFGKHVTEIINKAKSTGLDIKHVPLFESWEKYLGQVEDNGGERSLAYKEIGGLEKGAIAEIVSYGVKTSIGDDTKTIIILA